MLLTPLWLERLPVNSRERYVEVTMAKKSATLGEQLGRLGIGAGNFTTRPVIAGRRGVVTSGHYLATEAGMHMLRCGGNAIDAGVAMGFCLAVIEPHLNGIAGESPMLIRHAESSRVVAINGQGVAPRATNIEWFLQHDISLIPGDGLLPAIVPSQFDNWMTALLEFGTLPLAAILASAVDLARNDFPMYHGLRQAIADCQPRFEDEWPNSAAIYLPRRSVPQWGDLFFNPQWADIFDSLLRVATKNSHWGRAVSLEAARDVFYTGFIAERIAEFCRETKVCDATGSEHTGLLTYDDLTNYHAQVEQPVAVNYHGLDVYKCGPWSQGPVFLQMLRLLERFDLSAMGHNSADYVHTWIECAKLAFADREFYYGDPSFVDVPLDRLLSI